MSPDFLGHHGGIGGWQGLDGLADEPGGDLGASCHVQPVEEIGEIIFDRLLTQIELNADFFVGQPFAEEGEDLLMPGGELRERGPGQSLLLSEPLERGAHQNRIKRRLSCQHVADVGQ